MRTLGAGAGVLRHGAATPGACELSEACVFGAVLLCACAGMCVFESFVIFVCV